MKKFLMFFILLSIVVSTRINAQTYTVQVRVEDLFWNIKPDLTVEWECTAFADLYIDGVKQDTNYTYQWYQNSSDSFMWAGIGYSKFKDGNPGQFYDIFVTVTGNNFNVTSDTISIGLGGTPQNVFLKAFLDNSTEIPASNYFQVFTDPHWKRPFDNGGSYKLALGGDVANNTLRINPYDLPEYGEKFNYWNNTDEILNFNSFEITPSLTEIDANFKKRVNNVIIGVNFSEYPQNNIQIGFKDPWLVDFFVDQNLGSRNRGMSAPYKYYHSINFSDTAFSDYKGVFLDQNPSFDPNLPSYSVSVPLIKTINGSTAFFTGWTASPSGSAEFQNASADTTALVFTSDGATVTANYSYSTIAINTTLNAGTYNIAGTLTVSSGVTLTVNPGATLNFPIGGGLVVNGKLAADSAVFTSPSGSWKGITLSHAEGSSISNATISYALSPIIIDTTSSISISNTAINNSIFYDNNFNDAAAIQVRNSSPTITFVTIDGLPIVGSSGSWNGVRFTNSSTGSLSNSTIKNLGYGNGVIVQGGSSPTISNNNINNNYYYGIIVYMNGTGSPTIQSNTLDYNGLGGNYTGLYLYTSSGTVRINSISNSYYGIWSRYSSSITAGGVGEGGYNTVTYNTTGLLATDNSSIYFGDGISQKNQYWGICNEIYGNSRYDASAERGSYIYARYNWWGQYPLNQSKFYVDGTSSLHNDYPETSQGDCPLFGPLFAPAPGNANNNAGFATIPETDPATIIRVAMEYRFKGNYIKASSLLRKLLKDGKASSFHKQALVQLFNIFQSTGDLSIADDLAGFSSSKGDLGTTAGLLLASAYAGLGRTADAERVADNLKAANPNSEIEKRALFTLASLSAFDPGYKSKSKAAINELVQKYGSSVDAGLITALGGGSVNNNVAGKLSSSTPGNSNADSLKYQLGNYPNPFNPTTIIRYVIPKGGLVILKVYDMLGREVETLVNEYKTKGSYDVTFNAGNLPAGRQGLASGVYIYRIKVNNFSSVKKLLLMK